MKFVYYDIEVKTSKKDKEYNDLLVYNLTNIKNIGDCNNDWFVLVILT